MSETPSAIDKSAGTDTCPLCGARVRALDSLKVVCDECGIRFATERGGLKIDEPFPPPRLDYKFALRDRFTMRVRELLHQFHGGSREFTPQQVRLLVGLLIDLHTDLEGQIYYLAKWKGEHRCHHVFTPSTRPISRPIRKIGGVLYAK